MHFYFILFFTFLFCYFIFKKTQFHYTKHSNFNSSLFYYISNHKNHNFTPFFLLLLLNYFLFITKFKNSKKTLTFTNSPKMHISLHFISFSTNCASRFFFTYNNSSLSNTSPLTTKNHPKKSFKNSFFAKFQTTLSYPPLNLIFALLVTKNTQKFIITSNKPKTLKNSRKTIQNREFKTTIFQERMRMS